MKKFIITILATLLILTTVGCASNKVYMYVPVFGFDAEEYSECKDAGEVYVMKFTRDNTKYYLVQKDHVWFMT